MSHSSVVDKFFRDGGLYLEEMGINGDPSRIYNIDESWVGSKTEGKKNKVVVPSDCTIPYLLKTTCEEHITFSLCICADGSFLPSMATFAKSIPQGDDFLISGPPKALYNVTESGHVDTQLYLQYIQHIEPSLSSKRPVVIFQDNLSAHESLQLVEFCVSKGIHLINFPSKLTHILQPLDKLFDPIKAHLNGKVQEASLIVSELKRVQIPVLVRFALQAMDPDTVKSSFSKTGIFPWNRKAISDSVLVGDTPTCEQLSSEAECRIISYDCVKKPTFHLEVYDESGIVVESVATTVSTSAQTDPVASLPCSNCVKADVSLHPMVQNNMVDLELA